METTVSIRASLQQRGERRVEDFQIEEIFVSIRASLQQRGERADGSDLPAARSFNPRLTSAARRTLSGKRKGSQNRVSIRASLQQRGEHFGCSQRRPGRLVSIRASLQQRGEHAYNHLYHHLSSGFNPRLTSAARRTIVFPTAAVPH